MRKKQEFKPDRLGTGVLDKLWLTPLQQLRVLRWALFGVVCVVGLLMQDVLLYRIDIGGGCTDLMPCLIIMVAVMQEPESGGIFALVMSVVYFFSGSAPGVHSIFLLTVLSVAVTIFRQVCLWRGFGAVMTCSSAAMFVYEMALFGVNLFLKQTTLQRFGAAMVTGRLSVLSLFLAYPVLRAISKIGGDSWKE